MSRSQDTPQLNKLSASEEIVCMWKVNNIIYIYCKYTVTAKLCHNIMYVVARVESADGIILYNPCTLYLGH